MKRICVILAAAASLSFAGGAQAATASGQLTVQASVVDSCSVANATLNFGQVNPANGTLLPTTGLVNVTCSLGTPFTVGMDDGANASSGQRRMRRGTTSDYLNYDLYLDLLMQNRFGDTDTSDRFIGLTGLGLVANVVTLYGAVASGQTAGGGAYSDTVQVIVHF